MSSLPESFEDGAAFGVYAAYRITDFVPHGTLDFVCWKLSSDPYFELYRIPGVRGTSLPPDLRLGGTFRSDFEATQLTALQGVRRFPPDVPGRSVFDFGAEVCLQCFALDTELFNQARKDNRLIFLHEISPLSDNQWGYVEYYEKYPKPLYEVRYDDRRIALVNGDHFTLADDHHSLSIHQDFFAWRVWINDSTTPIKDAFSISPPIFTLAGPGDITICETDELFIEKEADGEEFDAC
ncbi:hypothetical protein [Bowdeniella massiliensis]|uniref:hypothetical protein n=1 Tax=Bowdeniella massiliensis TaxID=2932264 RepID=UPI0020282548|nr:hypothetical protein [Bowdeniella massiliensis]